MDSISLYSLIARISVFGFIIGNVLLIVSIVLTAKKKKKFAIGIAGGILLIIAGVVFFAYAALNTLIDCLDGMAGNITVATSFTPAEGSRPVSGTLKIDGHEVTMPCKVTDFEHMGYDSDNVYFSGFIYMWPRSNKNGSYEPPHFQARIDNSYGYTSNDHVRGCDQVSAIEIHDDYGIAFEFNELEFGMSKDDFLEIYGPPAYEIDHPTMGDFLYYVGENDTIYRFTFGDHHGDNYYLIGIMYGTSEYMEYEMNGLYH